MTKPRQPVVRVVKGRSAKQKAAAKRFSGVIAKSVASTTPTAPTSSYWVGASREELRAKVEQEQPRMANSKFGRISDPTL